MTQQNFELIIELAMLSIGLYLAFFKSYFQEKGKNLATLEDIEEITKIVESVKQDNNTQLELIKTELSLVTKTQIVIYDDERKAIIEFVGAINDFMESEIYIPIEEHNPEGIAFFIERMRSFDIGFSKVQLANSRLKLFCFNDDLISKSHVIVTNLLEIRGKSIHFRTLLLTEMNSLKLLRDFDPLPEERPSHLIEYKDGINKTNAIYSEYYKELSEFYEKYIVIFTEFQNICKEYLRTKKASI